MADKSSVISNKKSWLQLLKKGTRSHTGISMAVYTSHNNLFVINL